MVPYNDTESYPQEIGKLLNFLQDNATDIIENRNSAVNSLGVLTIQVLSVIPASNSALEQLLEEHGWNNEELRYEYSVVGDGSHGIDYHSLSQALGTLYLAHLAQPEEVEESVSIKRRTRTNSSVAFEDIELTAKRSLLQPDYLYYSFAPSIVFKILASMIAEDTSNRGGIAANSTVVPFALDEKGDEASFQLKPTKSFFFSKSFADYSSDHSADNSGFSDSMSGGGANTIKNSMAKAIANAYTVPSPSPNANANINSNNTTNKNASNSKNGENDTQLSCREADFMGACLLADISGFTKLSASFCKNGSAGLDKLHQATNGLLGNFVRIVYKFHGDVIAFAGDALICVFPIADGEDVKFELKKVCQLASHIGVSCGYMSMGILGGHENKWVYLMNGACISEISSCIDDAGPGEVVVTNEVHNHISNDGLTYAPGTELIVANQMKGSGNYKLIHISSNFGGHIQYSYNRYDGLNLTTNITSAVRLFVPRTVDHGISTGTFLSMSELREVTTLFLKLDTYDPIRNRSPMTLQPFFQMAQKEVAHMGGFMRRVVY